MIKYFCDICGKEVKHDNMNEMIIKIRPYSYSKKDTTITGELCIDCSRKFLIMFKEFYNLKN